MDSNSYVLVIIGLLLSLSGLITIGDKEERVESLVFTLVGMALVFIGVILR